MAVNDCKKPVYIFASYLFSSFFPTSFVAKTHSGDFFAEYRTTKFDPDNSIDKDFKKFDLDSGVYLDLAFNGALLNYNAKNPA